MVRHLQGSYFLATNVFLDLGTSTFTAGATEPLTNGNDLAYALALFNSTNLTSGTNYTVAATNHTGQTFIIAYNTNADFIGQSKLPGPFTVYGVLGQYVTNTPYTSGYQFIPTRAADLVALGPPQIVGQPTNQLLTLGANAAFAVTVTGSSPLELPMALQRNQPDGRWPDYRLAKQPACDKQCPIARHGVLPGRGDECVRVGHQRPGAAFSVQHRRPGLEQRQRAGHASPRRNPIPPCR